MSFFVPTTNQTQDDNDNESDNSQVVDVIIPVVEIDPLDAETMISESKKEVDSTKEIIAVVNEDNDSFNFEEDDKKKKILKRKKTASTNSTSLKTKDLNSSSNAMIDSAISKTLSKRGPKKHKILVDNTNIKPRSNLNDHVISIGLNEDQTNTFKKEIEQINSSLWPSLYLQITSSGIRICNMNEGMTGVPPFLVHLEWPSSFFSWFHLDGESPENPTSLKQDILLAEEKEPRYLLHFEQADFNKKMSTADKFDYVELFFTKSDFEKCKSKIETKIQVTNHHFVQKSIKLVYSPFYCLPWLNVQMRKGSSGGLGSVLGNCSFKITKTLIPLKEIACPTRDSIESRYPFVLNSIPAEEFKEKILFFIRNQTPSLSFVTDGDNLFLYGKTKDGSDIDILENSIVKKEDSYENLLPECHDLLKNMGTEITSNAERFIQNITKLTNNYKWKAGEYKLSYVQNIVKSIRTKSQNINFHFGSGGIFVMQILETDSDPVITTYLFNQ